MKILAFSDIHDNLPCIRKLRAQETNSYDLIVVAGDIGDDIFNDFLGIVATFECPVYYVYGNWDNRLKYEPSHIHNCKLLHMDIYEINGFYFAGYSGCPTHWGQNPIAIRIWSEKINEVSKNNIKRKTELSKIATQIYTENRQTLFNEIRKSGIDLKRLFLVSHERIYRTHEEFDGIMCHIYGHRHGFKHSIYHATHFVNVSALDTIKTMIKPDGSEFNVNAGTYCVIDIDGDNNIDIQSKQLTVNLGQCHFQGFTMIGLPWAAEENAFL